jgi:hypothetical protein
VLVLVLSEAALVLSEAALVLSEAALVLSEAVLVLSEAALVLSEAVLVLVLVLDQESHSPIGSVESKHERAGNGRGVHLRLDGPGSEGEISS